MSLLNLKEKGISELTDPFRADCVYHFHVWCDKRDFGGWSYTGNIKFKNGSTKGEQEFKAESLGAVLKKMEKFVEQLQNA